MANVVPFPRAHRPKEETLWSEYMLAIARFHRSLKTGDLDIEKMRACVSAYDAFIAEFSKEPDA